MIHELEADAAVAMWPDVQHLVQAALRHNPTNDISLDDIERQLAKNYAVMLAATDDEGEVVGVTVVQLFVLRGKRVVHVLCTSGEDMSAWLDDLIDYLRDMADRQGASAVTMAGRPGWTKTLTRYGFRSEHVTMRMEVLDNGRVRKEREQPPEPAIERVVRGPEPSAVPGEPTERGADVGLRAVGSDPGGGPGA